MKIQRNVFKQLFNLKRAITPVVHTLILLISIIPVVATADRFDPPSLKGPLQDFDSRISGDIFNVDFLLAHILNNARQTERLGQDLYNQSQNLLQDTAIFTTGIDTGAVSNSVVIPPGTNAETIIVINQNEGDSIAIQR